MHCVSCEGAGPTVPSPLVGEGQGEGWRRSAEREALAMQRLESQGPQHFEQLLNR
jgi:hypothetical protein